MQRIRSKDGRVGICGGRSAVIGDNVTFEKKSGLAQNERELNWAPSAAPRIVSLEKPMQASPIREIRTNPDASARSGTATSTPEQTSVAAESQRTANGLDKLLFELGVEPSMTVHEAAAVLRWSYWKARRYFSQVEGICVSYRPKRYKRPYRPFTIPLSIFAREWQKMTGHEPEAAEVSRRRLALATQK